MTALQRVIRGAVDGAETIEEWAAGRPILAAERDKVVDLATRKPIYGFNTLLGHLDHLDQGGLQEPLLAGHLLGTSTTSGGAALNLMTAAKLEQIHAGGSGIHPATFDLVRTTSFDPAAEYGGAWLASYGSGDVVPGAWWLAAVLRRNDMSAEDLHPGDVIALINGTHVSTARSIGVLASAVEVASRVIGVLREISLLDRTEPLPGWVGEVADSFSAATASSPQASVASRDCRPVLVSAYTELRRLRDAIDSRLSGFSGNPRFVDDGAAGIVDISQSSFLDAQLTTALMSLLTHLRFAAAAVVGVMHHRVRAESADVDRAAQIAGVQPVKIATAKLVELDQIAPRPVFALQESHGVEDLADGALLTSVDVERALRVVGELLDMCSDAAPDSVAGERAVGERIAADLGLPWEILDGLRTGLR